MDDGQISHSQSGVVGARYEEQCSPSPAYTTLLVSFPDSAAPLSLIDECALSFITPLSVVKQER